MQNFIYRFNSANNAQILPVYARIAILRSTNRLFLYCKYFQVTETKIEFNLVTRDISFSVEANVPEEQNSNNAMVKMTFNAKDVLRTTTKA